MFFFIKFRKRMKTVGWRMLWCYWLTSPRIMFASRKRLLLQQWMLVLRDSSNTQNAPRLPVFHLPLTLPSREGFTALMDTTSNWRAKQADTPKHILNTVMSTQMCLPTFFVIKMQHFPTSHWLLALCIVPDSRTCAGLSFHMSPKSRFAPPSIYSSIKVIITCYYLSEQSPAKSP